MKLGIIISMFPEIHETFIVRELAALERENIDFEIFSIQKPRDPVTIDDAVRLMETRTHYAPLFGAKQLLALFKCLVTRPVRTISAISRLIIAGWNTPKELAKSIAILPVTLFFGYEMSEKGITHIHGHWANVPTTACWILSSVLDFSWSAAIHGEDIFSSNKLLERKLDDAAFTVVCTKYFRDHLRKNMNHSHPEDIHLNYHGLDPKVSAYSNVQHTTRVHREGGTTKVLSIGRLVPTKGHDDLIRAIKLVSDTPHNIELNIIGSGPEKESLLELATRTGIADRVSFSGMMPLDEVMACFLDADIFVLACRMIPGHPPDGIPNVLAEAMALGVPVVSTRVSAIPELIEHEITGLLVDPDQPASLAHAIMAIGSDRALANSLKTAAMAKVADMYDQEKNILDLIAIFESYIGPVRPATD